MRAKPFLCHLDVYQQPKKDRHKLTHYGTRARSRHSKKHAQREQSPWLLVSSLGPDEARAKQGIQLERTRLQREEAFDMAKQIETPQLSGF